MSVLREVRNALKPAVKALLYSGSARWCALCERPARAFRPFGTPPRADAMCPWCGSLERHRLAVEFFRHRTDLFDGRPKRLLHVAPEARFERLLRSAAGEGYLSGDLFDTHAMERMDITDIRHPDASFDVIYCSHVLEHVPDDRKAMREFARVLSPGGWAVLNVPVTADRTFEDPSIEDPAERLRLFGQEDHVRRYGPDYEDRLVEAGFRVRRMSPRDVVPADQLGRCGLGSPATGDVYYCQRAT